MNEVDELLLIHFGKKGMKWGHRTKSNNTKEEKKNRNKKIAIGLGVIAGTTAITVGALYVKNHMNVPIKQVPKLSNSIDTKTFIEAFSKKQAIINQAANEDLKAIYKLAETPIRRRGYLPTWT